MTVAENINEHYSFYLAKGRWTDLEAACIFYNIHPKNNIRRNEVHHNLYIENVFANELYNIIKTWNKTLADAEPWWYLNEILKSKLIKPHSSLLSATSEIIFDYSQQDKDRILKQYPYLSKAISLSFHPITTISTEVDCYKQIIDKTYYHFWHQVNPAAIPKRETIIEWIMKEFKIAKRNASAIDTMIRPKPYNKGGNKKR